MALVRALRSRARVEVWQRYCWCATAQHLGKRHSQGPEPTGAGTKENTAMEGLLHSAVTGARGMLSLVPAPHPSQLSARAFCPITAPERGKKAGCSPSVILLLRGSCRKPAASCQDDQRGYSHSSGGEINHQGVLAR